MANIHDKVGGVVVIRTMQPRVAEVLDDLIDGSLIEDPAGDHVNHCVE